MINEHDEYYDDDNLNAEKIPVRLTLNGGQLLMITMVMTMMMTTLMKSPMRLTLPGTLTITSGVRPYL